MDYKPQAAHARNSTDQRTLLVNGALQAFLGANHPGPSTERAVNRLFWQGNSWMDRVAQFQMITVLGLELAMHRSGKDRFYAVAEHMFLK